MNSPIPAGQAATTVTVSTPGNLLYWQAAALTFGATTVWALYAYAKLRTQHKRETKRLGGELKRHEAARSALQGWLTD